MGPGDAQVKDVRQHGGCRCLEVLDIIAQHRASTNHVSRVRKHWPIDDAGGENPGMEPPRHHLSRPFQNTAGPQPDAISHPTTLLSLIFAFWCFSHNDIIISLSLNVINLILLEHQHISIIILITLCIRLVDLGIVRQFAVLFQVASFFDGIFDDDVGLVVLEISQGDQDDVAGVDPDLRGATEKVSILPMSFLCLLNGGIMASAVRLTFFLILPRM